MAVGEEQGALGMVEEKEEQGELEMAAREEGGVLEMAAREEEEVLGMAAAGEVGRVLSAAAREERRGVLSKAGEAVSARAGQKGWGSPAYPPAG